MCRHVLHTAAALLTFTVSLLAVGTLNDLAFALPAALTVFILIKEILQRNSDLCRVWFDSTEITNTASSDGLPAR